MKKCKHLNVGYMEDVEVWHCKKCGEIFKSDPHNDFENNYYGDDGEPIVKPLDKKDDSK